MSERLRTVVYSVHSLSAACFDTGDDVDSEEGVMAPTDVHTPRASSERTIRHQLDRAIGRALIHHPFALRLLAEPTLALDDAESTLEHRIALHEIHATNLADFAQQAFTRFWPAAVPAPRDERGTAHRRAVASSGAEHLDGLSSSLGGIRGGGARSPISAAMPNQVAGRTDGSHASTDPLSSWPRTPGRTSGPPPQMAGFVVGVQCWLPLGYWSAASVT